MIKGAVEGNDIAARLRLPPGPMGVERERRCLAALLARAGLTGRTAAAACEVKKKTMFE